MAKDNPFHDEAFRQKFIKDAMEYDSKTIKDRIEDDRYYFRNVYYEDFVQKLDPFIRELLEKNKGTNPPVFPAVDLGASTAVTTIGMALNFMPPFHQGALVWYPTDTTRHTESEEEDGGMLERETRPSLRYHIEETQEIRDNPLFADKEGEVVFKGDLVNMRGLKAKQYNGKRGIIRGPDPNTQGRFAVQVSSDTDDCKSFKSENLVFGWHVLPGPLALRLLRLDKSDVVFFEGLLNRSCEINLWDHETWSNVTELDGQCALVTCTSVLSSVGYRLPKLWQDTMQLASKLLRKDGYLAQWDTYRFGSIVVGKDDDDFQFGDIQAMQAYVEEMSLGLTLVESNIPPEGRINKLFIWQKT